MKNTNNMKTVETVKEYNSKQLGSNMMFLNEDGSPKKRGFVVTIDGASKLCKTIEECNSINEFVKETVLPCYSHGGSRPLIDEIND
jgi:hypothetical protein